MARSSSNTIKGNVYSLEDQHLDPLPCNYSQITMDKIDESICGLETKQKVALEASENLRQCSLKEVNDYFDSINARIVAFIRGEINKLEEERTKLARQIEDNENELALQRHFVLECAKKSYDHGEVSTPEVEIAVLPVVGWDASLVAVLQMRGGGQPRPTADVPRTVSAFTLVEKQFIRQKEVRLKKCPAALRLIGQQLWACQDRGVIQIYNDELQLLRTIRNRRWGSVHDVTELSSDGLVIANSSDGLYQVTASGADVRQIDTGKFTSVVFHDHMLYGYCCFPPRECTYAFDALHDQWDKLETFRLPVSDGAYVTLSVNDARIYACSNHDNLLIVMSLSGKILQALGEGGSGASGQVISPYLCHENERGSLLIADSGKNRLQEVETSGRWSTVRTTPSVRSPRGAVCTQCRLYVTTRGNGYRLSLYTCPES